MRTAVVPLNSSALTFQWTFAETGVDDNHFYANIHFMELLPDTKRTFSLYMDDLVWYSNFTPRYLIVDSVFNNSPMKSEDRYNWSLDSTGLSKLPPIFNAMEVYSPMYLVEEATDENDVATIRAIKERYQIKRNWMGDPCVPIAYSWDGLKCSSNQIISLNLSLSNLTGEITKAFGNLSALEDLYLSGNNLTGQIPVVLGELQSLKVLDLRDNQISVPIPDLLISKSQNGLLLLRLEGNPDVCSNGKLCGQTTTSSSKTVSLPIAIVLCVVPIILLSVGISIFCRPRKSLMLWKKNYSKQVLGREENGLQLESRQFTYAELKEITNEFAKVLGKGGFGNVYHGCLEDGTEVAIKMRSESSSQGTKEFLSEARHLSRVHHRNLVSMIGYCNDGNCLALVYEFMSQGTLQEHLRGSSKAYRPLAWRERLQIALESAQGLEYLHKGCKPPLIHRDLKTANILLSGKLEAKIADFGLSKDFHNDVNSHISTAVVGTPGYLDPEYYNNFQISEKSDIYSFGVVLFELITGQPPVIQGSGCTYIVHWARQRLAQGNIEDIVDAELQGQYDVNSVWKCTDVALKCTTPTSQQRPSISDVVMELKERLALETSCGDLSASYNDSLKEVSEMRQNGALDLQNFVEYR